MAKEMFLTGIVSEWMAEDVRFELTNSSKKDIDIYLSSWGGSVNKGFEIANLIQGMSSKKNINLYILSHADSIATVIFLSAKKENRHVVESSTMFVHEPRMIVFDEVTQGDADKMSQELEIQKNRIADFYVKNIEGLTKEEAFSLMSGDTTLTTDKMIELGIINNVMPAFEIAAQRKLISNSNNKNMGLFSNKKEPINTLAMSDGTTIAYQGELKEGVEVQKIGEIVDLNGEFEDNDGNKYTIEANKIANVEAKAEENTSESITAEEISEIVAAALVENNKEIEKKFDDKLEAMRKTGSNQKVPKVENNQAKADIIGTQATARANVSKYLKDIAAKKKELRDN